MAISYAKFKRTFGDLGITEWVKFNWLSNAGIARNIYNKLVETGYNPLAYVNNELYNRITKSINIWDEEWELGGINDSTGQNETGSTIRSKKYIGVVPSTIYHILTPTNGIYQIFLYDTNKSFMYAVLMSNIANGNYTIPSGCHYLRFRCFISYGTTYNHDICINLSNPYINGNYFPYFEGEKFLVLVGKYTFTGNEKWTISETYAYISGTPSNGKKRGLVLTDAVIPSTITLKELDGTHGIIIVTYSSENQPTLSELHSIFSNRKTFDYELVSPILIDI